MLGALKKLVISSQLPNWRRDVELEDGYTILLPSPMDIPFMLRLGLEGLQHIDTSRCRQVLVVPDGWGDDNGEGLRRVASEFDDPRISFVDLSPRDYRLIRAMKPPGCAATHWMQFVNGTKHARCEYAFLHDADAFFLERDGLENQYDQAREREACTLGVTPRWDPFFVDNGYTIPGTWELMYSVRWARRWGPFEFKGRRVKTPHGENEFDSMLYPQYVDHGSGKVLVMDPPPRLVHFSGTIFAYRTALASNGGQVTDELFRVLLLSVLEEVLSIDHRDRTLPTVDKLALGLTRDDSPVLYLSEKNRVGYAEFRHHVESMCGSPVFAGQRAERICSALKPFDEHFDFDRTRSYEAAIKPGEMRTVAVQ